MKGTTKRFLISSVVARDKAIPAAFIANVMIETERAVYVYGHGSMDPTGHCARCGMPLTHPGSILIGIGPECLNDWGARDIILDSITPEQQEHLKALIQERKVNNWLPKACIKSIDETDEVVKVPADHPMVKREPGTIINKEAKLISNNTLKITFPYNTEDLGAVKSIPGRRFFNAGNDKYWTCPMTPEAIEILHKRGFSMDSEILKQMAEKETKKQEIVNLTSIPGLKSGPTGTGLRPFQLEGVAFLEQREGRGIIGDEMGLGKTVQALAWLQLHPEKRPAVIVVPASLKLNWAQEAKMWMANPKVQIISGTKGTDALRGEIIIANYDILPGWVGKLQQLKPKVMICDECHYFKNNKAKRTKAIKMLAKNIPHIIPLSGTPIVNRPVEFYNALKLVDSDGILPSFWKYAQRYCGAKHNGFGWDFNGASKTDELHEITKALMLRRKKDEVLKELPDKTRSFMPLELDNYREYKRAEEDFIAWLKENRGEKAAAKAKSAEVLTKIEVMKQLAVKGKMQEALEWIRNFLEVDGKLVVFATHKTTINSLMNEFEKIAVKVDGSVTGHMRDQAVQKFQNDESCRLFVGNIKAAGVGLTLTAASNVVILELPWTPGDLLQAEDRCHRIGQKNAVNIHYLLASGTIEEKIAAMLDQKRQVLDAVLDGVETDQSSLLSELMKIYQEG